jgi:hypothetical protein
MKTLSEWMREGDPLLRDPSLSEAEATAIRRRVVGEAIGRTAGHVAWRDTLAVAAAVALMVAVGVTTGRRLPPPAVPSTGTDDESARPAEPRQLQFATPGGTRIIWTFDPEFNLKETVP